MATTYKTSKEECERRIKGVCEGCGGKLEAMETVDNSGDPTYWVGCEHCCSFRSGVDEKHFKIARKLIEDGRILDYTHIKKEDYKTEEELSYYYDTETASLSRTIAEIAYLLKEGD